MHVFTAGPDRQRQNTPAASIFSRDSTGRRGTLGFSDNRPGAAKQAGLQSLIDSSPKLAATLQCLVDFNRADMTGCNLSANSDSTALQRMTKTQGETVVSNVNHQVPKAANRLFGIIFSGGKTIDRKRLTDDVLNTLNLPLDNNLNHTVTRAGVAGITKGAVCDNYQDMAIAEIARSGLAAATDTVHREWYPGHSYVSITDTAANPVNHNNDLIVDAWRNFVDRRSDFKVFKQYRNAYNQVAATPMAGGTDWLNDAAAQQAVDNFLTLQGFTNPSRDVNMKGYMEANPGRSGNIFLL